MTKEELKVV